MILKGLLNTANKIISQIKETAEQNKKSVPYTEEDILAAIENLPVDPPEPVGYQEDELTGKVPKVGTWSMFQYLTDSPSGIEDENKKFFYAIPCGREFGQEVKIWYLGAYLNGTYEDIFEFYTSYDYTKE